MFRLGGSDFHIAIFIVHHSQNKMCYSSHIYYAISILLNMYFHIKTIYCAFDKNKRLHSISGVFFLCKKKIKKSLFENKNLKKMKKHNKCELINKFYFENDVK